MSGDISYCKFAVNVNAGANTVLKVYVDDCLVHTDTIDNSSGTEGVQPTISVTRFLAGQHTIKVEIAEISGGGLTFVMVDARLRPAATTTDTSSAAQMQAILVDTKENGI